MGTGDVYLLRVIEALLFTGTAVPGPLGELEGDLEANTIRVRRFGQPEEIIDLAAGTSEFAGHGVLPCWMPQWVPVMYIFSAS